MKNSDDTIGNGTRDLPASSAVPQPTAPPRISMYTYIIIFMLTIQPSMAVQMRYNNINSKLDAAMTNFIDNYNQINI